MEEIEKKEDFLSYLKFILSYNIITEDLLLNIAGVLAKYEPKISKKLYSIINTPTSNLIFNRWNKIQKEIEEKNKKEIERYKKWKEENPEEHKKILEEFNKILDNLEEKLKNKEKTL